jgi:hypothetical protein
MLLRWPELPFRPEEQVLGMLFDGGMLTREQIKILAGWTDAKIKYCFRRIYEKKGPEEEPMIQYQFLPGPRFRSRVYSLTMTGVRYVHEMMELEAKLRTVSEGQLFHYLGINNVVIRAVQRFGRDNVTWLSSREVTEELYLSRRLYSVENDPKGRLIRPDAAIAVQGGRSAWIEYDNATESTAKLEGKFRAYVNLYRELGKFTKPVLWIAPTQERRTFLQRVYMALKKQLQWPDEPLQLFFVEGEEQDWIGNKNSVREASGRAG